VSQTLIEAPSSMAWVIDPINRMARNDLFNRFTEICRIAPSATHRRAIRHHLHRTGIPTSIYGMIIA
jgi:hypothetical protein